MIFLFFFEKYFEVSGPKEAKICSKFQLLGKIDTYVFSDFLNDTILAQSLKIDPNYFVLKKSCFEVFGPKGAQNDFFQVLSKMNTWNFSNFFHEVT